MGGYAGARRVRIVPREVMRGLVVVTGAWLTASDVWSEGLSSGQQRQ
jgi:uncharacterized membrane protein YfcA